MIKKGTHAPLRAPHPIIGFKSMKYRFRMGQGCRYTLPAEDQGDINKLIGVGYVNSIPFNGSKPLPFHHCNSVRVGWHYDPQGDKVVLWAYWYSEKQRNSKEICRVDIDQQFDVTVSRSGSKHTLKVDAGGKVLGASYVEVRPSGIGYLLRPYFGGNNTAPHDMTIEMSKI